MKKLLWTILSVVFIFCIGCSNSSTNTTKSISEDAKLLMPGATVKINKESFAAISKPAFEKLVGYTASKNTVGAQRMLVDGQLLILKPMDYGELLEVASGSVKIKITNGFYKGQTAYVYREMVTRVPPDEAYSADERAKQEAKKKQADVLKYSNFGKYDLSKVQKTEVTDEGRAKYQQWMKEFSKKITTYPELDAQAVEMIDDFKKNKSVKLYEVEALWNKMDEIRVALLDDSNVPKGLSPAIDDQLWRMRSDYLGGINDRQAGLWAIVEYLQKNSKYKTALEAVDSCLTTSSEFFAYYNKRKMEFTRIFEP